MNRVVLGLAASILLHGVLLQVAMSEPKNQFEVNVNSGKMSMAIKQQVKEKETEKKKTKPEPKPPKQPDKRENDTKKDKRKEKKKTKKKQTDETKTTPASKKRRGAEWVKKADYRSNPSPDYPPRSRRLGEEGTVILTVLVDKKGQPESVTVKQSSGHDRLDNAALETVRDWEFTPASTAGVPVKSTVLVPVRYQLQD